MDGEVDLGAARQVLDIAVSTMFRTAGNGSCAFLANFLLQSFVSSAGVDVLGVRRLSYIAAHVRTFRDELILATVPFCKDFSGRSATEDSWVNEAWEADVGDMARGAEDAFKVPDGFCSVVC